MDRRRVSDSHRTLCLIRSAARCRCLGPYAISVPSPVAIALARSDGAFGSLEF